MAVRFSIAEWSFLKPGMDPAQFYPAAAALGILGAELVRDDHRSAALQAGLTLVNRDGPGRGRGWNRVSDQARCLAELQPALADAVAHHIPDLLVFSGNREGQDDATSLAACIDGLGQAAELARSAGRRLLLEVFNTFDHPDYAADSSAFAYHVVRAVNSPHLRVLYDAYHMWRMGEDVNRTLFDNLQWVGHIHIARSPDRKVATDARSIDLVRALDRAGYAGWVGLEWLPDDSLAELADFMVRVR